MPLREQIGLSGRQVRVLLESSGWRAWMLLTMLRTTPTTMGYPTRSINDTMVKKLWYVLSFPFEVPIPMDGSGERDLKLS